MIYTLNLSFKENLAVKEFNQRNTYLNISPNGNYIHNWKNVDENIKVLNAWRHSKYIERVLTADVEQLPFVDTI